MLVKIVCQWVSDGMLQNVITVRYLRHTCPRVSQTAMATVSPMTWPFFNCLPLLQEGRFGSIEVRN
jgi:hypothetical protein